MTPTEATVKCPICGEPYKVYAFFTGDQSACPKCVAKAEEYKRQFSQSPSK